jgi:hypothetical protein
MEEAPKPRQDVIFINYRKMGTGWSANLLATELERIFGEDRVFQDVEGIRAGDRFAVNLEETGSVLFTPPVDVTAIRDHIGKATFAAHLPPAIQFPTLANRKPIIPDDVNDVVDRPRKRAVSLMNRCRLRFKM